MLHKCLLPPSSGHETYARLHGATIQKTGIFVLATMGIQKLINLISVLEEAMSEVSGL
jgi:hypothetical protein